MTPPTAAEIEGWAKTIAALGGIFVALWALVSKVRRRLRDRQRLRSLESKAIRYLLDAQRQTLHFVTPTKESRAVDIEAMLRHKALIDEVRDELWIADGYESERERLQLAEDVGRWLTRTQAIHLKLGTAPEPPMFADEEKS